MDRLLLNRYLGIPIFLGIMWLIFQTTFTWIGTPLSDQLDAFISGPLSEWIKSVMNTLHITSFLQDLITDGIIAVWVLYWYLYHKLLCYSFYFFIRRFRLYGKNSCING